MESFNPEKWMSELPDERKLVLINIPGSHDSTANNMNVFGSKFAKTQNYDIKGQLKIGVRKFDIRVAIRPPNFLKKSLSQDVIDGDRDLICVHGMCDCYYFENKKKRHLVYKDILLDLKKFLEEDEKEVIILETDSGRGNRYNHIKRSIEIREKILGDMAINYNKNMTLAEARGKVVCTCFQTGEKDGKPQFNMNNIGGKGINEIHYNLEDNYSTWKVDGKAKVKELTILFEIAKDFKTVEDDFEKNSKDYPLVYSISCTGEQNNKLFYPDPYAQFKVVKPFFMNYEFKKGYYYGWIHIDFVDLDIAKKIIETNFL